MLEIYLISYGVFCLVLALVGTFNYVRHNKRAKEAEKDFNALEESLEIGATTLNDIEAYKALKPIKMSFRRIRIEYFYYDSMDSYRKRGKGLIIKLDRRSRAKKITKYKIAGGKRMNIIE